METIKTNEVARQNRIEQEVRKAFELCKTEAELGATYVWFTTDRDIQRDVRYLLENNHKIIVPIFCPRHGTSYPQVEHNGERTEMKLKWL